MKVHTRFAPSPTGYLHVGSARSALFNWLFARHHQGHYDLRIEDTDQVRNTPAAVDSILDGLQWLGLDWDGELVYQSQRIPLYDHHLDQLIGTGAAYRCICTAEELAERRKAAAERGEDPKYDRRCRDRGHGPDQPHVVRFKMPGSGEVVFDDLVHGPIRVAVDTLDDFVLRRSDGLPTYNFAVVVDDHLMGMTHVIRGDDHISNTPRQIQLYQAFGWEIPRFGHIPMILGPDKAKLSKRHGATSVTVYRDEGFLAEAMVNYLARLGWSHGDQEVFSLEELIAYFSIDKVQKTAAVFDRTKLEWLNGVYMRERLAPEELAKRMRPFWERAGYDLSQYQDADLVRIVVSLRERVKTLVQMAEDSAFYFAVQPMLPEAREKLTPEGLALLSELQQCLERVTDWDHASLEQVFKGLAEEKGIKLGVLMQPARVALTGKTTSPSTYDMLEILGRQRSLERFRLTLNLAGAV